MRREAPRAIRVGAALDGERVTASMGEYDVLLNGDVWDPRDGRRADQWIGVSGETVEGVFDTKPGEAESILTAEVFTPGLIDLHSHLVWDGSSDPVATLEQETREELTVRAVENARETLLGGVTTIRDLGSVRDIAITVGHAIQAGRLVGPTVVPSGRTIIISGGHDPFWGIPSDGVDACVSAVRTLRAAGAEVIKISATGGVYGQAIGEKPGASELTREEIAAIVEEANRFGLPVAAHAVGREGIANAVAAGVTTIEHGNLMDPDTLDRLIANDIFYVPTLFIYRDIATGSSGVPAYARENALGVYEHHAEVVERAIEEGARIGAGSDAGSPGLPHPGLHRELMALVDAGMPEAAALTAATATAAAAIGYPELGTLAAGTPASIVGFDADPLADISTVSSPSIVVKHGRVVKAPGATPIPLGSE